MMSSGSGRKKTRRARRGGSHDGIARKATDAELETDIKKIEREIDALKKLQKAHAQSRDIKHRRELADGIKAKKKSLALAKKEKKRRMSGSGKRTRRNH